MNHAPYPPDLARLLAAARRAPDGRAVSAPFGFSTRVAARALAGGAAAGSLFERFAFRAMGIAALLTVGSFAANFSTVNSLLRGEAAAPGAVSTVLSDDPVGELVDAAS